MIVDDLKPLIKGTAQLQYVMGGGIAVYHILSTDDHKYHLEINLSDTQDVGATAAFHPVEKAIILMRWIRKANENDTLICVK